jgi:hypothetical protein
MRFVELRHRARVSLLLSYGFPRRESMLHKQDAFFLFLIVNLSAVYTPGVIWLPSLPMRGASPWLLPLSPVLLVTFLLKSENPLPCCAALMAFLLMIANAVCKFLQLEKGWWSSLHQRIPPR